LEAEDFYTVCEVFLYAEQNYTGSNLKALTGPNCPRLVPHSRSYECLFLFCFFVRSLEISAVSGTKAWQWKYEGEARRFPECGDKKGTRNMFTYSDQVTKLLAA
jgi:hypothetical protein